MNRDLANLRAELAALKTYVTTRTQALEARIAQLEQGSAAATAAPTIAPAPTIPAPPVIPASTVSWGTPARAVFKIDDPAAKPTPPAAAPAATQPRTDAAESTRRPAGAERPNDTAKPAEAPPARDIAWADDQPQIEPLSAWLAAGFGPLLGPVALVLDKCRGLYEHYRDQGKTAVFFLTLAGLLAMVGGFGYLLQYSFTYLSPALKVGLGFAGSVAVGGLGGWIARRKPAFLEYGSSLVGLGVVFGYLCAYVMGPYYGLAGETASFLTWAGVTGIAYVLALVFETRIVAAITLVGGAVTPFVLGQTGPLGTEFLVYLLLLSAASLHLARRIAWPALAHLAFVLSVGLIEYTQLDATAGAWTLAALLHGFFYLYSYFWGCRGRQLRPSLETVEIGALTANLFYFIYAIGQTGLPPLAQGALFALNAGVLTAVFLGLRAGRSPIAALLSSQISLLIACAIFLLAPNEASTAVLWGLEGLTLVWLGRHYGALPLRGEGYLVLVPALGGLAWAAFTGIAAHGLGLGAHWLALAAFGGLLLGAYRLIGALDEESREWERGLATGLKEAFSGWAVLAFYVVGFLALGREALVLAGVPLLWAFWRTCRHGLYLTEALAFAQLALLGCYLGLALMAIGSPHALAYDAWFWVAMIELTVAGWGLRALYGRYYAAGPGRTLARALRLAQYLLAPAWLAACALTLLPHYLSDRPSVLWSPLSLDLLLIGAWLGLAGWRLRRERSDEPHAAGVLTLVRDAQSVWLTLITLYAVDAVAPGWGYAAAIVPAALLLWRGVRRSLAFTETFAWAHLGLFVLAIVFGSLRAGTFQLSGLDWPTRLAWVELFVAGWGGLWIYQRLGREGALQGFARGMRNLVYLALPLVFLPKVARHWPFYLPLAAWGSACLCWGLHRVTREAALRVELWLLAIATTVASVLGLLLALGPGIGGPAALAAVLAGTGFFAALCVLEGGFRRERFAQSEFRRMVTLGGYFAGLTVLALAYTLSGSLRLGLLAAGSYFFVLVITRPAWPPLRGSVAVAHALGWAAFAGALLSLWVSAERPWLDGMLAIAALSGLAYFSHARRPLRLGWRAEAAAYLSFHALLLAGYTALSQIAFGDAWAVSTTIALVLHATALLFLTLQPRFALLLKPSVALFVAAAVKILFYDMTGFSTPHKVIALMTIGAILLAAAYQFQRLKQRLVTAT